MKTAVVITVDTEANIAGGIEKFALGYRPVIDQFVACKVRGRSEGLGFLTRTLTERGQRATFFVEAAQAHYFGAGAMAPYVDQLLEAGQDVQLHVHPCWFSYRDGAPDFARRIADSCAVLDEPVLEDLFSRCVETLRGWTGVAPLVLRTGGFRTGRNVYRVMKRLGIPLSSSVCIGIYQPVEPELQQAGGCCIIEDVREYPSTSFLDDRGRPAPRWRPLQVRSCSSTELLAGLADAHASGDEIVVIVTHPFEYVKSVTASNRNDWNFERLNMNRLVRARFRRLCDYLMKHEDRFEVCTFADLASRAPSPVRAPVLRGSPVRSWLRTLENGVNDRLRWL